MYTVSVDDSRVTAWLDGMPGRVRERLETAVYAMAEKLRSHVVSDKLLGQVLNRVTGQLGRSIQYRVDSGQNFVVGAVFSAGDVVYGRIHEYGAVVTRRMEQAWGRPMKDPREVTFTYPERSFMRTSLADERDEIVEGIKRAVAEGMKG